MEFNELRNIEDEFQRVAAIYEIFNEDKRLNCSQAASVEFLTTMKYIEQYAEKGMKILDIGAGAGEYSLYLAERGFQVHALELADANIQAFERKIRPGMSLELVQGNAIDLSQYQDDSFDLVLLFGPLYHLEKEEYRQQCIREAKRVLKPGGVIFFSFISNDMVILTEFKKRKDFFLDDTYDHETFKLEDFPFVFFTVDQCRQMLLMEGISILREIASDGVTELMQDEVNAFDEASFSQYLRYHYSICEKPEMLGRSNHLLFIGRK